MKNVKFSKKVLVSIFIFLLLFVITMCILFYKTGNEPATLISCVFAFCGIEGGVLGWIKISEVKNNILDENTDEEDNI